MKNLLGLLLLVSVLTGCAFSPQKATINPTVSTVTGTEGKGVSVAVNVMDERPSKSLGRRGSAYGAAAEITTDGDLERIVSAKVSEALRSRGFSVLPTGSAKLNIEIRLLEYSTSRGAWTGGVHIQGALKAIGSKNGNTFEQMYRSSKEERIVVVPSAEKNEAWINEALSDVLNQLLSDQKLIDFLTN